MARGICNISQGVGSRLKLTLDDVLNAAPKALDELTRELLRRVIDARRADPKSQLTACLQLGLRSASIMHGMARVLDLHTLDSYETLNRAAIEARDLLMHFRLKDKATEDKIKYWFAGGKDNAWKADHAKVEEFLARQDALNTPLGKNWSKVSVLAHPTMYAAENSTVVVFHRRSGQGHLRGLDIRQKRADYVVGMARLHLATVYDLPGWISLGLNHANMPSFQWFCQNAELIGAPIVNEPLVQPLPEHSIRPPKKKT
jgi:hypothetical protein